MCWHAQRNPTYTSKIHPLLTQQPETMTKDLNATSPESNDLDSEDSSNDSEDTGNQQKWDPHAGMKPSHRDGHASDGEVNVKDDLPFDTAIEVNGNMMDLMHELGDNDPHDLDWLPLKVQKKLDQRKRDMISPASEPRSWSTYCDVQARRGKPLRLGLMSMQNLLNRNDAPSTEMQ